jgi:hypothetical protein
VPLVVVGDDQIDAALFRDLRLLDRGDAAVDGDNELRPGVTDLLKRLGIQPVAFVDPVGDVEIDLSAQDGDGVPEDGGGGDAVDVVVAVDDDFLLVPHRLGDAIGGLSQVWDRERVVQAFEAGAEEILALGRLLDAAVEQHLGQQRRGLKPLGQLRHAGVGLRDVPAFEAMHP